MKAKNNVLIFIAVLAMTVVVGMAAAVVLAKW